MADNNSRIRPDRAGGFGLPPARKSPSEPELALVEKPRRRRLPNIDPFDLEAAIARLGKLLALDKDGPQQLVPRGYYLNILV